MRKLPIVNQRPLTKTWGNVLDGTYELVSKIRAMNLENRLQLILLCNHEDSYVSQAAKNQLRFLTEKIKGVSGDDVMDKWSKVSIKLTADSDELIYIRILKMHLDGIKVK